MTPTHRRIEKGAELRDDLKAKGMHREAQIVADLVGSLRGSSALNSQLHRDLQDALSLSAGGEDEAWLDELEKLADAAMKMSPSPWTVKPRERGPCGNLPSEVVDKDGNWVASTDGAEEEAFIAAANPATIKRLISAARNGGA